MKKILTPAQWAENIGNDVKHKLFRTCKLVGVRVECESNNNLMLMVNTGFGEYYWVYDYETEVIINEQCTNDGEPIQVFVHYGSTLLERVGANYYLNACGFTYSLKEDDIRQLLNEMNTDEFNNPLKAASFLIDQQNRFVRISE